MSGAGAESLFERFWSFENLLRAYRDAARGKRGRPDVAAFDFDMEGRLLRLRDQLRDGSWRPHPYRRFSVADPKPRHMLASGLLKERDLPLRGTHIPGLLPAGGPHASGA